MDTFNHAETPGRPPAPGAGAKRRGQQPPAAGPQPPERAFDMSGRRVLVTGASAGIGAAIALRLAAAGAAVAAVSRSGRSPAATDDRPSAAGLAESAERHADADPHVRRPRQPSAAGLAESAERLQPSAQEGLQGGGPTGVGRSGVGRSGAGAGSVAPVSADLSEPSQLDAVVDRAAAACGGGLDTVVNNAGRGDWLPLAALDRDYFDGLVGLNLWAPLRICQLAHPYLAAAPGDAAVVMIGSVDAVRPSAGGAVYGATKAGLAAVAVALAKEWAPDGIRVTQVNPGLIDTPMAAGVVAELAESGRSINIAGRPGRPEEIAALVHYLVAPAGRFATGASFRVDGGAVALGPFDRREG